MVGNRLKIPTCITIMFTFANTFQMHVQCIVHGVISCPPTHRNIYVAHRNFHGAISLLKCRFFFISDRKIAPESATDVNEKITIRLPIHFNPFDFDMNIRNQYFNYFSKMLAAKLLSLPLRKKTEIFSQTHSHIYIDDY